MPTIAFVPVRYGSKSIPKKNIKNFCGRPLVYWSLKALQDSHSVNKIVLATESSEISDIVSRFDFSKVEIYNRDKTNAQDTSSTESVMLEYLNGANATQDDLFILCQATSPFTQPSDIDNAIKQLMAENADSLLSCCRLKRFIWDENGVPQNYDFKNRPRRQDFGGSLVENGAFYINKVSDILNSKNRLSGNISIYEMPEYTFTEIDEPEDWLVAESVMRKYILKSGNEKEIKLVLSDIDGVLTDAGMYYSENGDELKKFSTYDGMAFKLMRERGLKVGLVTTEDRELNKRRAEKLKVDFLYQGISDKLSVVKEICEKENFNLSEVAYIGDDINDKELLENVGFPFCPENARSVIKELPNITILKSRGGEGVLRDFYEYIFN